MARPAAGPAPAVAGRAARRTQLRPSKEEQASPTGANRDEGNEDGGNGPGPSPPIEGTCAALEACCGALGDQAQRISCGQTLAAAEARNGEADCAVVYSAYVAAGICRK